MTREEKQLEITHLADKFNQFDNIYITDTSALTVEQVTNLRRICHKEGVELKVAKNKLIKKAMEAITDKKFDGLFDTLAGPTAIMLASASNTPAKIIKQFRKTHEKPILKAAYIQSDIFKGDDQVEILSALKSKEELIGELIGLLQSPMKNVMSALASGSNNITGILKTLSQKGEAS